MTSTLNLEASLQDLLRPTSNSTELVTPVQLSPATFKSAIASVIDVLSEQRIPAIVWAKLPKGDAWQAELDRYRRLSGIAQGFYTFRCGKEDEAGDLLTEGPEIQLSNQGMRRDYFVLIWSSMFQGMLVTQKQAGDGEDEGDASERRTLLQGFWSCNQGLLKQALDQIEQSLLRPEAATWRSQLAELPAEQVTSPFLEHLFARQLQKQEDIWQRRTAYRKQAEMVEGLQSQYQELANTIREKDDFLSNAGQELRTPLTTIKTALTLLNSPSLKPPQRQRYMDLISKQCDRQSTLISSLLDLVQLEQSNEHLNLQALQLADIVPGIVSTYQPVAEEQGVMLAYTIPDSLPMVVCTSNWLQKMVVALLHNGIKFTPNGGRVWVKALVQGNDTVALEFQDSGIGIAPHEIPKIFDRFYRVRQVGEEEAGAGLGLCIAKQIATRCGGNLSVRSKPGEGSVFVISLPVHKG
jgi:two-component system, OmpR family, phosphate regulon sensor histidine kinase PhoR